MIYDLITWSLPWAICGFFFGRYATRHLENSTLHDYDKKSNVGRSAAVGISFLIALGFTLGRIAARFL